MTDFREEVLIENPLSFKKMIKPFHLTFFNPTRQSRLLSVLFSISENPDASQHKIAGTTSLSSSMVNNYIKLLEREGLIFIEGNTNRTKQYKLSSEGLGMLRQSLLEYSAEIVRLYTSVKEEVSNILEQFYRDGIRTIVLFGVAETAEIVYAAAKELPISIIGVLDSDRAKQGRLFNGLKIQSPMVIKKLRPDAVVITSFGRQEEIYQQVRKLTKNSIEIKKLLTVST